MGSFSGGFSCYSGRLWPDWGNNARAATVGLGSIGLKKNSSQNYTFCVKQKCLSETVKTKLKSDDWFKGYGPIKYPFGSSLGATILCTLTSMHLMSKSTCGSFYDVWDFQQFF